MRHSLNFIEVVSGRAARLALTLVWLAGASPAAEPEQRGLDEIDAIPVRTALCPVCSHQVAIPEVDLLMRWPPGAAGTGGWRMHAASRDADFCPHPGRNKVAFQADLAVCPSCGFTRKAKSFEEPVAPKLAAWVRENIQPGLRMIQAELIGRRAADMTEADIIAFFNQQGEVPDNLRLEYARVVEEALGAPALVRAETAWLAAWAIRRELSGPPSGAVLRRLTGNVEEALLKAVGSGGGTKVKAEALRRLISSTRSAASGGALTRPEQLAAKATLAGLLDRLGFRREAENELTEAKAAFGERFARPEQDPLWSATSAKNRQARRADELETLRRETEREIGTRLELVRRESEYLEMAAELIRQGILSGECDGQPELAYFHAYLAGEFIRRSGNLPLASEWLKTLTALLPADSPLGPTLGEQLRLLRDQAGDRINLLAALGEDGEVLAKLREIAKP